MKSFETSVINEAVQKLLRGEDYREEVINAINTRFFDFAITFFKEIIDAKYNNEAINYDWYKRKFIDSPGLSTQDLAIYAGINKKTITNIYGTANKKTVIEVSNNNLEYLINLLDNLEDEVLTGLSITIKLCHNDISVDLNLTESLLVINALATKKISIRGGAWSEIGKKVEKPLVLELCNRCKIPIDFIDSTIFKKDGSLDFDREVDFYFFNRDENKLRVEVKLMGKGNPESADAIIARDTNIFIADTLSAQNISQLQSLNVEYLVLKNNDKVIDDFKSILLKLDIPFEQ